jgi:transposase
MKSKDLQNIVLSKYRNGETATKIFQDLNGGLSRRTVFVWCKMIRETGTITLARPLGCPRIVRTKNLIQKVKSRLKRKKPVSIRKLANELDISTGSVYNILRDDLGYRAYKRRVQPLLTDAQKMKRKKFANWVRTNFKKEQTLKFVFSDEKMFDVNGMYNRQNQRVWAVDRREADENGGRKHKQKFPQKVMVWLAVSSTGVSPLVILDKGSVNHEKYIKEVLPVALKFGNKCFGNDWTYQQDGATPHTHRLTQEWCEEHFPSFLDKNHWPPNSPDLNPLDYSIWDEFVHQMNWNNVRSKQTLIEELKRAVKKIREKVVFESCNSFSNRLYRLSKNDFNYLH